MNPGPSRRAVTAAQRWLGARVDRILGAITHVETSQPVVALTFDDGPHPVATPHLLHLLSQYGAHATFFMIGCAAVRHRSILEQVVEAGHAVGNHSWDHASFPLLTAQERRAQIRACQKVLRPYGERLFRPPYGHQTTASRLDAFWLGYEVVTWNVNAIDWANDSPACIVERVASRLTPGSIVLFHDGQFEPGVETVPDRSRTLEAVSMLLERCHASFRFVTVPELIRCGRPVHEPWYLTAEGDLLSRLQAQAADLRQRVALR